MAAEQRILGEPVAELAVVEYEVWSKPPGVPVALGRKRSQVRECAGGDQLHWCGVVMRAGRAKATQGGCIRGLEADPALEQLRERVFDLVTFEGSRHPAA